MKLNTICIKALVILTLVNFSFPSFAQEEKKSSIHIGLLYPLSNHGIHAKNYSNVFSLHGIAGVSKREHGIALAGFANIVKEEASGVQIGGFANVIKEDASGVQIAGFTNVYKKGNGFQLAGFANLATGDVKGVQLAGFMNKAAKVRGVQFAAFMNIADSSDYPIGIVNLVKNGTKAIGLSFDEDQTVLATFRSGGRVMYGILGLGYNLQNEKQRYALEAGLGAHLLTKRAFTLNTEVTSTYLFDFHDGTYHKSSIRILPAYKISKRIEIYAGPSINHIFTNTSKGREMIRNNLWEKSLEPGEVNAINIGVMGGIQVYF